MSNLEHREPTREELQQLDEDVIARVELAKKLKAEYVGPFDAGFAPVRYRESNGRIAFYYIDKDGHALRTTETIRSASRFACNRALVGFDVDKGYYVPGVGYSYMTREGELITDELFARATDFNDDLGCVERDLSKDENDYRRESLYLDKLGKNALGRTFHDAKPFSDGLGLVQSIDESEIPSTGNTGQWQFYNKAGKPAFEGIFWNGEPHKNGFAIVTDILETGCKDIYTSKIINKRGEVLAENGGNGNDYFVVVNDTEGRQWVLCVNEYFAYEQDGGKVFFDESEDFSAITVIGELSEDGKLIEQERSWGNKHERYGKYQEGLPMSEGKIRVQAENGLYGYKNVAGDWVISPEYEVAEPFSDGLAIVSKVKKGLLTVIDHSGKIVKGPLNEKFCKPRFNRPEEFWRFEDPHTPKVFDHGVIEMQSGSGSVYMDRHFRPIFGWKGNPYL